MTMKPVRQRTPESREAIRTAPQVDQEMTHGTALGSLLSRFLTPEHSFYTLFLKRAKNNLQSILIILNIKSHFIGPIGLANEQKCVGCRACETACPKNMITVKTMSERLLSINTEDGAHAPCAQTCPAQIDIPRYISQIKAGDYEGAVATIRERNPLLLACGRVCPHPCEDKCRRRIEDEPVSINQLQRFAAD